MNRTRPWRVAVVDDEPTLCRRLSQILAKEGYEVATFLEAASFLEAMAAMPFDLVFMDLRLPDLDGLALLPQVKHKWRHTEVIMITGYGSIDGAIAAMKSGAYHYATKPLRLAEIRHLARQALEKVAVQRENLALRRALAGGNILERIVGNSPAMQEVLALVHKVAPVDCNVLIEGPSGTGKQLVAQAIHQLSHRAGGAFVTFNCGGFTEELISSELFGYEKGAFTGATATKVGLLEAANGGTVFLDEIGEMPPAMQVRLLHVIQDRRIIRVGGVRPLHLDIRIIAATNKELDHEVQAGRFRQDLYYRLNVVRIRLPSLEERRDDIPLLVSHFIAKFAAAFGKEVDGIDPEALGILQRYNYPGNVRELENIIERAVALANDRIIRVRDLPEDLRQLQVDAYPGEEFVPLEQVERQYIGKVLEKTSYNCSLAAQILGLPRTTLWRRMKKYGLSKKGRR